MPEVAETCAPAIRELRSQLAATERDADELVTVSQPPLSWSPLIIGLAMHVLTHPTLLGTAEHLRGQMVAQARRIESPMRTDYPAQFKRWPESPSAGLSGSLGSN
jgi:hypothetical protein